MSGGAARRAPQLRPFSRCPFPLHPPRKSALKSESTCRLLAGARDCDPWVLWRVPLPVADTCDLFMYLRICVCACAAAGLRLGWALAWVCKLAVVCCGTGTSGTTGKVHCVRRTLCSTLRSVGTARGTGNVVRLIWCFRHAPCGVGHVLCACCGRNRSSLGMLQQQQLQGAARLHVYAAAGMASQQAAS